MSEQSKEQENSCSSCDNSKCQNMGMDNIFKECCITCGYDKTACPSLKCDYEEGYENCGLWQPKQSKEVESGYEYARDMLIDCANNNYALVKDLAEQYCDRILKEGERMAIEKVKEIINNFNFDCSDGYGSEAYVKDKSIEKLLTELDKIKEPKGEGK